ncbi:MAG: N-acetylmuramoyl-L-alanine amidase family protein [Bacteroidales bacterium]
MKKQIRNCLTLLLGLSLCTSIYAAGPFKIVIDPGHGGKDPGAIGKKTREKHINLAIALKLGDQIKQRHDDVKVIYTRSNDKSVGLQDRADIANKAKADLFISIHTNAIKATSVKGTETYTLGLRRSDENLEVVKRENSVILLEDDYKVKYQGFDPNSAESYIMFELIQDKHMDQSIRMASLIQKHFKGHSGRINRGVRQDAFLVLRNTSMPSVLVEVGFISNPEEERYLMTESGQESLASAIYKAFVEFKSEFDKRNGTYAISEKSGRDNVNDSRTSIVVATEVKEEANSSSSVASNARNTNATTSKTPSSKSGRVVYKVQIMTHPKKLSANSSFFKGLKNIDHYIEKGQYKYTVGASSSRSEMENLRRKIAPKFKDAFVIKTVDNKRIN